MLRCKNKGKEFIWVTAGCILLTGAVFACFFWGKSSLGKTANRSEQEIASMDLESLEGSRICLANGATTAEDDAVSVEGDVITITGAGCYEIDGTLTDGQLVVDAEGADVILLMDGAAITCNNSAALYVKEAATVTVYTRSGTENSLCSVGEYEAIDEYNIDGAVFARSNITLLGEGALSVESEYGHGIAVKGTLEIISGDYDVVCHEDALHVKENLTVCGGNIAICAGDDALHAEEDLLIADGVIDIEECYEGLEGHTITLDGGDICITASDDGLNASNPESDSSSMDPMASDETCSITINGGELYVVAQGDGIDSNGDIIVTGGNIRISTMANGADSAIDYSGEAYITGGTVVACGGSAMAQNFGENSTQGSILQCLNETVEGQVVLYDAGGNELLSYTPENAYNCVVVSAPEILIGENYQLEIAGESYDIAMESVIYGMSQGMGFGALQKFNGKMSENLDGERPEMPEGFDGKMPEDFDGERPEMPEGFDGKMPEDFDGERPEMPEGFDGKMPVDN